MIAMKCTHCGHSMEVTDSVRGGEVRCARCGQIIEPSFADAATIASKLHAGSTGADLEGGAATHKEGQDSETIAPHASGPVEVFPFLGPAKAAGELGWLGHYRVVKLLGQGGMGIVFEAVDTQLQRPVALKVMKPDVAKDEGARQRFLREARMTASVKSDHVVVIHQVNESDQVPYLAMEFLRGEPLDRWLERHGRPSMEAVLRIGMEVARGLAAAHALGLIHRDIKPANIWLEARDAGQPGQTNASVTGTAAALPRVKILDFGLARVAKEKAHLTHTGLVLGTPAYMSPEQAEGGDVDARSDLFSLGCVLYELATGAKPFSGTNTMALLMAVAMKAPLSPAEINPDLPPSFCDLILRLLAKRPQERPPSAVAVVTSLQAIADELGLSGNTPSSGIQRTVPSTMKTSHIPPRRRYWAIGGGIVAALLAVGLVAWFIAARFAPPPADNEILLGMSAPFTGPSRELGIEMRRGVETYLHHINDEKGVHGRKIRLIALDDGYEPTQALANMKELHEKDHVFAVIGNVGTPTADKTVPYAVDNKLLFFGAFTGAKLLRKDPPDRYVFNYRASYEEETAKIVEYLVEIRKIRPDQIGVFDQNDQFGDAGFSGVAKVMRKSYKRDPNDIFRVRYERNTIHVQDAVDKVLKNPDLKAVVMVGTYRPITEFIRRLKDRQRDLIFTNVSFVGSEALAEGLHELGESYCEGVIVTQVVPPIDSNATLVLKYNELRKKYYPTTHPSFTSLEGYIATALFVEGLKRAGPDPTSEKVIDSLETIRDFELGIGAPLTFTSSEHQASHKVWATVLNKDGHFKVLDMTE